MANFIKHVGKHGDRKVAVIYRKVPQEDHMCLVIYPETIPAAWHDAIMKVLESDVGQQSKELADALFRSMLPDSRLILETLHNERMIKKVPTKDVIMTPRSDASIRLDELNTMLDEMEKGDEAIKKMAENDAARGLVDPSVKRGAEERYKAEQAARNTQVAENFAAPQTGALSDRQLAANMLTQAKRMEQEAKGMIAEAARMKKEAEKMDPYVVASNAVDTPAETAEPTAETTEVKRGRGRPPKATAAVGDALNG